MAGEFISLLANLALTLSFIVALIIGIVQIRVANRNRREMLTLETLRNFQTREFAELINSINTTKLPNTHETWNSLPDDQRILFIQFLQQMESVGILIAEKAINVALVDKTLGIFVHSSWKKYKPLILDMREKIPDPYLSEYFQWMAEEIDKRLKEKPRKPFYLEDMKPLK